MGNGRGPFEGFKAKIKDPPLIHTSKQCYQIIRQKGELSFMVYESVLNIQKNETIPHPRIYHSTYPGL